LKNCIAGAIEAAIVEMAVEQPTFGQVRVRPRARQAGSLRVPGPPCAASDTGKRSGDYKEGLMALEGQE
jgi:hypothetical protein